MTDKGKKMKKYEDVSEEFYTKKGVKHYLKCEFVNNTSKVTLRDDVSTNFYEHSALGAEWWRLEQKQDKEMTADWIRENVDDIVCYLVKGPYDMLGVYLAITAKTWPCDSSAVRDYVYEHAEDIAKAHHELFDD